MSKTNFKLTDELEKQMLIKSFDVDYYINIFFDNHIRELEPKDFIEKINVEQNLVLTCSAVRGGYRIAPLIRQNGNA